MPSLVEELASKIIEACRDPGQVGKARIAAADTLSVAGAGYRLATHKPAPPSSTGKALVAGSWSRAHPIEAAAVNAFYAHSIELDDWNPRGYVHAGTVVVPAALSAALEAEADMELFLRGIVAGYQAAYMVGGYLGRSHYSKWHTTSTAGLVGSTVAVRTILSDCSPSGIEGLIQVSANYAGGLWSVPRVNPALKPVSAMTAASAGYILAVNTPEAGMGEPVLGEVCRLLSGTCTGVPQGYSLDYNGYKFYPTCRHTHTSIEAALRLREKLGFTIDMIDEVVVETYREAVRVAGGRGFPSSVEEARFNLGYLVALALGRGNVWFDTLHDGLSDSRITGLYKRVRIVENKDYTEMYPDYQPSTVKAKIHGAGWVSETVSLPLGDPGRGVSRRDILDKASRLSEATGDQRIYMVAEWIMESGNRALLKELVEYISLNTA